MRRRRFLKVAAALAAAPLADSLAPGRARRFDYAWLKGEARALAAAPHAAPEAALPEALAGLDFDGYQAIRFRPERSLWADAGLEFRAQFFHRGFLAVNRARIHEVVQGEAREIAYDPAMFDFSKSPVRARSLRNDLGFAGFRISFGADWSTDITAFLGASYFRAVGASKQYGASARGLAIDTGMEGGEEFPVFTSFWLERPAKGSDRLVLYALLDSPSVAGAYRFEIQPAATLVMDVDAALYARKRIRRLGVAPLTSMYHFGENDRRRAEDWRPEIHDSDGLSLWTGAGEWIWRALVNPKSIRVNSFFDEDPRGFGLLQRDRSFDHYQDDGVYYDRRPSIWVEPRPVSGRGWGKGAVQLVELPAEDETYDNIVAYWNPAEPPAPGAETLLAYRLHWGAQMPYASPLAQVVATRTGIGGIVGQKRKYFSWRFAVDFAGGDLALLGAGTQVEPVIRASRGRVEITSARPLREIGGYRAMFDLVPDQSPEPIDLRLHLRAGARALSETWVYQWAL
jgi:glucans biosynthesis protein